MKTKGKYILLVCFIILVFVFIRRFTIVDKSNISNVVTVNNISNDNNGTGFIYGNKDNRYYVVTNYHVISNGDNISIVVNDEDIDVDVIGYDKKYDIAVLGFNYDKKIPNVKLGNSDIVNVLDEVFTYDMLDEMKVILGNVTDTNVDVIVSYDDKEDNINVIEVNAKYKVGNSGSPLFNRNYEVVGIVSMKLSNKADVGYVIPISNVEDIIDNIIKTD